MAEELTGSEIIDLFAKIAPYLNDVLATDVSGDSVKRIAGSLSDIRAAIQTLSQEIDVIDQSVGGQTAGIDEMAKASQSLAMMATQLSGAAREMYQITD